MTRNEYLEIAAEYNKGIYIGACKPCPYNGTPECDKCIYSTERYLKAQREYYSNKNN